MSHDKAIEHVAQWLDTSGLYIFTGRKHGVNTLMTPRPVFEQCIKADPQFWADTYGYTNEKGQGQRGGMYHIFRDAILLDALHRCLTTQMQRGLPHAEPAKPVYLFKSSTLNNGNPSPRAISGWERSRVQKL